MSAIHCILRRIFSTKIDADARLITMVKDGFALEMRIRTRSPSPGDAGRQQTIIE